jgi:outer membrane immunogenic protein
MAKLLLATSGLIALVAAPTLAADMSAPFTAAPVPAFNWTGFYLGANLGLLGSNFFITDAAAASTFNLVNSNGFMGGGQVGYNFQAGTFVFGVEFDGDGTTLKLHTSFLPTPAGSLLQGSATTPWVTTLAGRLGLAAGPWLFYGKGGAGWVDNRVVFTDLTTGLSATTTNATVGWLAGGGVEYAIVPNWTVKFEYDHIGVKDWTAGSPVAGDTINVHRNVDLFKTGFNYKL